jgi:hypothetical protein
MGLFCSSNPWSVLLSDLLTLASPLLIPFLFSIAKSVSSLNPCDWRIALCVTNGHSDLPHQIYIYDGNSLSDQLERRCHEILSKKIRIDSSPPSLLTSTPSIILPKSLSSLIPVVATSNGRVSPGLDPSRNFGSPSNIDEPRLWLPVLMSYLRPDDQRLLEQIFQTNHRIYVLFEIPDYSHFVFLQLKSDQLLVGEKEEEGEEEEEEEGEEEERGAAVSQNGNDKREEKEQLESKTASADDDDKISSLPQKRHSMTHPPSQAEADLHHDRSVSLDSARGTSPLKKKSLDTNSAAVHSTLPTNLFAEATPTNNMKPPIPLPPPSSSPRSPYPIDALRVALQSDPQGTNKGKGKKKNFFGWRSSS